MKVIERKGGWRMERKWEGVNEGGGRVSDFVRVKRRGGRERKERGRVGGRE